MTKVLHSADAHRLVIVYTRCQQRQVRIGAAELVLDRDQPAREVPYWMLLSDADSAVHVNAFVGNCARGPANL